MTTNSRTGVQEPREECLNVPWKDTKKMIHFETSLHVNVSDAGGGRRLFLRNTVYRLPSDASIWCPRQDTTCKQMTSV